MTCRTVKAVDLPSAAIARLGPWIDEAPPRASRGGGCRAEGARPSTTGGSRRWIAGGGKSGSAEDSQTCGPAAPAPPGGDGPQGPGPHCL
ncbi:MAG: hypothetical protein JW986_02900 [Methanotrichaceae archaeon]|nr:hypothetical protein [Methanotrichaceae archaeon]